MKTRNLWIFVLTAFFCGVFFCTSVNASVCFVGDSSCGSGANFGSYTDPSKTNEDFCNKEGYTTKVGECNSPNNVGGVCPYDASWVKCCDPEYAYQACGYPLEKVDRCGKLYSCKCSEGYKTLKEWKEDGADNCTVGGDICFLDTDNDNPVRYADCICNNTYYPYTKCPDKAEPTDTCIDSDKNTYYACECPSEYKICDIRKAAGANECTINGITKYDSCMTEEQACVNDGYHTNCPDLDCYYDTYGTAEVDKLYQVKCERSDMVCPYAYGYYKCIWSAYNYCAKGGMTIQDRTIPTSCTVDGVAGTVVPCYLGYTTDEEEYYGYEYLGYYQCKLTCAQQAAAAEVDGTLTEDPYFKGLTAGETRGYYLKDKSGNFHLYLTGKEFDVMGFTDSQVTSGSASSWSSGNGSGNLYSGTYAHTYSSINGVAALYDYDSSTFSSCIDERDIDNRPTLVFDHYKIQSSDQTYLDVDLSDINVQFYAREPDDTDSYGETYNITKSHTWKNVKLSMYVPTHTDCITEAGHWNKAPKGCIYEYKDIGLYYKARRYDSEVCTVDGNTWFGSHFDIQGGYDTTMTFTGAIDFNFPIVESKVDDSNINKYACNNQNTPEFAMYPRTEGTKFIFQDAAISVNVGAQSHALDWHGASGATMIFRNSYGYMGNVWSYWNVGIESVPSGKTLSFDLLEIEGWSNFESNASIGGTSGFSSSYSIGCYGLYIGSGDVLIDGPFRIDNQFSKVYVGNGATLTSSYPLVLAVSGNSEICIDDGGSFTGTASRCNYSASMTVTYEGRAIYYAKGYTNVCLPPRYKTGALSSSYAEGCSLQGEPTGITTVDVYNTWVGYRSSNGYNHQGSSGNINGWASACGGCEYFGMGYNQ